MEKENRQKVYVVIAGSEETKTTLVNQIRETFGDEICLRALTMNSGIATPIEGDFLIISSQSAREELEESGILTGDIPYFVCERTLSFQAIEKVIDIPKGEKVLFVNDAKQTTEDCIENLLEIGIDHVEYVAYYPGEDCPPVGKLDAYAAAITAGEVALVPVGIKHVIDVGPRIIDILSLLEIAKLAGVQECDRNKIIKPYTKKIIEISRKMTLVNAESQELKHTLREKLESRGHVAPYRFENILGDSPDILEAKERAEKLAKTDLTVLLEGESGTGKELFASAMHNHSPRRHGPFLAVNFSALPEELVESELFGYEEGAFTGARKGGKVGLFQKADRGTIFLDEIGDISPKMQMKLLRVLQEKEIMPVGGSHIQKVDIRIIAATNKDLKDMVENGQFRSDLYYRLKMGYVYLPPLRQRKQDLRPLVNFFVQGETQSEVRVDEDVFCSFMEYDWVGNVREVSNTVKYMLAVRNEADRISVRDLPDERYFRKGQKRGHGDADGRGESGMAGAGLPDAYMEPEELLSVLGAIEAVRRQAGSAGRGAIAEALKKTEWPLTEGQVRNRLGLLERAGYVKSFRGKRGTVLSPVGRQLLLSSLATNDNH